MKPQSGFIDADDARIYFERVGSGPSVLFLHAGVADLRMWDYQVEVLQDRFDCIRFDMRGMGRTENKAETFSSSDDVALVLDYVQAASAHVVGISMGGATGLDFALQNPGRVSSLTLVAAGVGGWSEPPNEAELAELAEIDKAFEAQDWDRVAELETQYWLDGPGKAGRVRGEVREKMRQMCRLGYERGEPDVRLVALDPPAIGRLSEISTPTLIIVGTFDESSIIDMAEMFHQQVQGSSKITYEGVAHMVNLDQPHRFNSDLLDFLTSITA